MTSAFDGHVLNRVMRAIEKVTQVHPANITSGTRLTEDLALGRFGRLRLAICLEEVFDLELPNEVVARFVTVGDVVGYFSGRYFRDFDFPAPITAAAA
jgi:acyl carrier protein